MPDDVSKDIEPMRSERRMHWRFPIQGRQSCPSPPVLQDDVPAQSPTSIVSDSQGSASLVSEQVVETQSQTQASLAGDDDDDDGPDGEGCTDLTGL